MVRDLPDENLVFVNFIKFKNIRPPHLANLREQDRNLSHNFNTKLLVLEFILYTFPVYEVCA